MVAHPESAARGEVAAIQPPERTATVHRNAWSLTCSGANRRSSRRGGSLRLSAIVSRSQRTSRDIPCRAYFTDATDFWGANMRPVMVETICSVVGRGSIDLGSSGGA